MADDLSIFLIFLETSVDTFSVSQYQLKDLAQYWKYCIFMFVFFRMKVKKLPMILALHLKRFKYMDQLHRYTKLSYRVVFPLELRLFNTSGDATNPDRMYDLVAVVVHCGR